MKVLICLDQVVLNSDFSTNESATKKIKTWLESGVDVEFITERNKFVELKKIDDILKDIGLDGAHIHKKMDDENFQEVVEKNMPKLFIECKSVDGIGGAISNKFKKDFKLKKVLLNSGDEIVRLPDLPDELKDFALEEEVTEV